MDGKKIIFPKIQNKCLPETQTIALQAESEFIMVKERKLDSDHEVMWIPFVSGDVEFINIWEFLVETSQSLK